MGLPIKAKQPETPILPASRWMKADNTLVKTYSFFRQEDRQRFVTGLFNYEIQVQHNADMLVKQSEVTVMVKTENIGVTELDYEYARYCDSLYRDITYSIDASVRNHKQNQW